MKKALMGTMMAGALIIGAGASTGTYSDFFSSASSTGNQIELGTLELSQTGELGALVNTTNLKPGSSVDGTGVTVGNTGSLSGVLSASLTNFGLVDGDGNAIAAADYGNYSDIKVGLKVNGHSIGEVSVTELPGLVSQLNTYLQGYALASGEEYSITPTVKINRTSGDQNHLQGVNVSGDISWELRQN
jgi:hypothetical protein